MLVFAMGLLIGYVVSYIFFEKRIRFVQDRLFKLLISQSKEKNAVAKFPSKSSKDDDQDPPTELGDYAILRPRNPNSGIFSAAKEIPREWTHSGTKVPIKHLNPLLQSFNDLYGSPACEVWGG